MNKSKTTTPATSVVESASASTRTAMERTGTTTTSVKIAKQRGTSALNSNLTTETTTMIKNNFFEQPVGRAVMFLNDFHFGKHLNDLNRCARLVPKDVKGMASLLAGIPQADADTASMAIEELNKWANDKEKSQA